MVRQTRARPIAGVGIGAIVIRRIAARRTRDPIRVRTKPGRTNVVGTVIPVIRAGRAIGEIRMRAGPGAVTNVVSTLVPVIRARGAG